jgi:hypothetical protein
MLKPALIALALLAFAPAAVAQDPYRTETVRFAKGASSKTLTGAIRGDQGVNYLLDVRAGQTIKVTMKTSNASAYFNVVAPGVDDALFIGSSSGTNFVGKAPVSGPHKIIVYLMRNAARRNEVANYTLTFGVTR